MAIQKSIFGPTWGPRIARAGLRLAKMAGYDAGKPSRTFAQHSRLGSNPNSVNSQIERVRMEWNAEWLAKNSALGIGYIRQRMNYCSPLGWMPNTGDATLNGEIRAYIDEWMEDGGMNCSAYDSFARIANVQLPVRGDAALVWMRDESRLRVMEAGGDQIGELNVYGNPTYISKLGLTYFSGMYFDANSVRQAFRIYSKGTNDYYFSPNEFPSSDVMYFQDNLFGGVRGVTIFHGTIKTLSKSDQLFQFGMDAAQKQAKTGVVVRNEQGGPMGDLSYDTEVTDDGNVVYIERTFDGAQTQYQYNGDSYEVIKTDAPGQALIDGCEYADERSCLSLGFPFSFLVNARDVGGAPSRLEISKAGKEVERLRRLQGLQFKRMMYIVIMDAMDRGALRGATIQRLYATRLTRGTPKFPNLPTADAFRETQDDIASNRAGIETRASILSRTNEDWPTVLSSNRQEAMDISMAVQDANRLLAKRLSPVDFQPYEGDITAADVAQNSDNPQQSAAGEAIANNQIVPNPPGSGKGQVTDNPPNITRGVFSAYIGDILAGDLPQSTQSDIANILGTNGTTGKLKLIKYGMVPSELEKMADAHNLESAQKHIRNMPNYACSQDVHGDQEKHCLIQNNKLIDGHHFLAKALKGGVTKSLPVIDLSPARFQGAALEEWDETKHPRGQSENAGEFGNGASGGKKTLSDSSKKEFREDFGFSDREIQDLETNGKASKTYKEFLAGGGDDDRDAVKELKTLDSFNKTPTKAKTLKSDYHTDSKEDSEFTNQSVVKDTVFHGSISGELPKDFDGRDISFFTPSRSVAKAYATGDAVGAYKIDLRKPMEAHSPKDILDKLPENLRKRHEGDEKSYNVLLQPGSDFLTDDDVISCLKDQGYDGVILHDDQYTENGRLEPHSSYGVFDHDAVRKKDEKSAP